jgi:hypothetical protein
MLKPEKAESFVLHHRHSLGKLCSNNTYSADKPLVQTQQQRNMRRDHGKQPDLTIPGIKRFTTLPSGVAFYYRDHKEYEDNPTKQVMQMYKACLHNVVLRALK